MLSILFLQCSCEKTENAFPYKCFLIILQLLSMNSCSGLSFLSIVYLNPGRLLWLKGEKYLRSNMVLQHSKSCLIFCAIWKKNLVIEKKKHKMFVIDHIYCAPEKIELTYGCRPLVTILECILVKIIKKRFTFIFNTSTSLSQTWNNLKMQDE